MPENNPALRRGITILQMLSDNGPASLEQIVEQTGFPRSSTHRILGTLIEMELLDKPDDSPRYRALQCLRPLCESTPLTFEEQLAETMSELAAGTEQTVEWYVEMPDGAVQVRRRQPKGSQVHIIAQPGFLRQWTGELEAVCQVLRSHSDNTPNNFSNMWTYDAEGQKVKLKAAETKRIIDKARRDNIGLDPHYNTNGIRRIASPVMDGDRLVGILALAMCYTPDWKKKEATLRKKLKRAAESLYA